LNDSKGEAELIESFAAEARRRCEVIFSGLETGSTDYESLRAEAHALKGTAATVGLQRLAELAGLMESDLSDAAKSGQRKSGRGRQIAEAAQALAEGAEAAAEGKDEPPDVGRSLAALFSV
jgi:HPt (histidine-containing phosphotransfer) domain-containing protein